MTGTHLPDQELQLIACNGKEPSAEESAHLVHCGICQAGIAAYRLITEEIKLQSTPAFGFDITALVLPQIQPAPVKVPREKWLIYLFPVMLAIGCVPIYLFRKNIFYVFTGISTFFMYAVAGAAILVLTYRILLMYKEYKKRIKALNFY